MVSIQSVHDYSEPAQILADYPARRSFGSDRDGPFRADRDQPFRTGDDFPMVISSESAIAIISER